MKNLDAYYKKVKEDFGQSTADAAKELLSLYTDGIYKWLAGLWDGEIGGFYYSNSARDNEEFLPDIESTQQAFCALCDDGIVSSMSDYPEGMKKKAVAFITGCQDAEDGYFYHKQWGKDINTSRRARDMNKGMSIVRAFGANSKYPTADERIKAAMEGRAENISVMIPEHLSSRAAFVEYLESLEINKNSYSVGHRLGAQVSQIRAAGLDGVLYDFLNSTQKANGLCCKAMKRQ